jgi:hypothetical protein
MTPFRGLAYKKAKRFDVQVKENERAKSAGSCEVIDTL